MSNYSDAEIYDFIKSSGYLDAGGNVKDTEAGLGIYRDARKYGVSADRIDSAMQTANKAWKSGTAASWLSERGLDPLTGQPPTATTKPETSSTVWETAPTSAPNWAADPQQAAGALTAMAGPVQAPKPMAVSGDMLASRQLERLLTSDSPYVQRARTSAAEYAASRGLLNSTMGAQAGEAAAIDSALPVAQADAQSYLEAGRVTANAENSFASDANQFGRQGALTALSAGFQAQRDQLGYANERDLATLRETSADERQKREIDAAAARADEQRGWQSGEGALDRAAEVSRVQQARDSELQASYRNAMTRVMDSYNATMLTIQASDMDADVKAAQIAQARGALDSSTQWLSTLYSNSPGWVSEWSTFAVEGA